MASKTEAAAEAEQFEHPYPTQAQVDRVKRGLPAGEADEIEAVKPPKVEGKEMTADKQAYANRQMTKAD